MYTHTSTRQANILVDQDDISGLDPADQLDALTGPLDRTVTGESFADASAAGKDRLVGPQRHSHGKFPLAHLQLSAPARDILRSTLHCTDCYGPFCARLEAVSCRTQLKRISSAGTCCSVSQGGAAILRRRGGPWTSQNPLTNFAAKTPMFEPHSSRQEQPRQQGRGADAAVPRQLPLGLACHRPGSGSPSHAIPAKRLFTIIYRVCVFFCPSRVFSSGTALPARG